MNGFDVMRLVTLVLKNTVILACRYSGADGRRHTARAIQHDVANEFGQTFCAHSRRNCSIETYTAVPALPER